MFATAVVRERVERGYEAVSGAVSEAPSETMSDAEADRVEELADEIATLAAHVHAATHRLLVMIAEFDRLRGWERAGFRSCAHWLAFRTGFELGSSREKVRAARALESLPETSAAMARGELSFAKVRALTRAATPENEHALLELARSGTAAQIERVVRSWKRLGREDEVELERRRHAARCLSVFVDADGTYVVRGRLTPEAGVLLMRAIEAASDALYRGGASEGAAEGAREAKPEQRRADALALLAERAMGAGFGGNGTEGGAPVSGTRAERYQVVLHVEEETLRRNGEPGRADFEDGTRVSSETCRRLACDASVVEVRHRADGSVLDVGRKRRTVPPALRRALEVRDRGCRFPGCGSRFTDAHHVRHWADGGKTSLDNTILLCPHHHRLLHEGGFHLELNPWPGGRPVFYDRRGLPVPERPPEPRGLSERPVEALVRENERRGVKADHATARARYKYAEDVPIEIWAGALEALEGATSG